MEKNILRFISICVLTAGIILNTPIYLTKITMTVYIVRLYTTKSYNNMFLNLSVMLIQRYLMVTVENWKTVNVMK